MTTEAEKEVIGLCIALEAIDDIANHQLFQMRDVRAYPGEAELFFETGVHKDMFLVRLLDFAKEDGAKSLTGVHGSCLAILRSAVQNPSFDHNGSAAELERAVIELDKWLKAKPTVKLWLPTLDLKAQVSISNLDLITISGNHSKHNLSRLTGVLGRIAKVLREHKYQVDEEMLPLALDDLRDHLADNYFVYYSTWLAELLNNIRWGLQTYLQPTFDTSMRQLPDGMYRYEYPPSITGEIPRRWYWRLMNNVRRRPNLKRFKGARYLKNVSSLE